MALYFDSTSTNDLFITQNAKNFIIESNIYYLL